ncbi:MAG TPA: hypothetical protein PLR25_23950, partial [Planctomycetaceae bacterium]|nr:hypothetical protein [Planctomycetaceae bacterium]
VGGATGVQYTRRSADGKVQRRELASIRDREVDFGQVPRRAAEFNLPKMSPCRRYPTWGGSDYVGRSVSDLHPSAWSMANGRLASGTALVIPFLPLA